MVYLEHNNIMKKLTLEQSKLLDVDVKNGFLLHQQGKVEQAKIIYQKALEIDPQNFNALQLLGLVFLEQGDLERSVEFLQQAVQIKPSETICLMNLANAFFKLSQYSKALELYFKSSNIDPSLSQAFYGLGLCYDHLGQWEEAILSYSNAIVLRPNFVDALQNRGACYEEIKEWQLAIDNYDEVIRLDSTYSKAYSNKGNALKELGFFEDAIQNITKSIELNPFFAEAYSNLGVLYRDLNQIDKAIECYDKAISIDPNYHSAKFNKSMALLVSGDLVNGFREYEWRWESKGFKSGKRNFKQPLWLGDESLSNKTIFIYYEQGFGDTIQFCRYLVKLSNIAKKVIFEVDSLLFDLMKTLDCEITLIPKGTEFSEFDFHTPLLSLPHAFKTSIDNLPIEINYLKSDPKKVLFWKEKIERVTISKKPRIGLVWSGAYINNADYRSFNERRNIPLEKFKRLNEIDAHFFSFQKGEIAELELRSLKQSDWNGPEIFDFTSELKNFSDTAAFLDNMDLLISVDTSCAHLAGAIGKPVWLLNRFDTCWRWMLNRNDSPWYPTLKQYRQKNMLDWNSVINQLVTDLASQKSQWHI
jgi:tetratricopeptide (TPR) repeat protein